MRYVIALGLLATALAACQTTPTSTQPGTTQASAPVATATPAPNPLPSAPAQPAIARAAQIDQVTPGDEAAEQKHHLQGQADDTGDWTDRTYRHAVAGWFSWDLKVYPDEPATLLVTYAGVDKRAFNILIDDKLISKDTQPGSDSDFYEHKYPIPPELTKGKDKITVKFQSIGEGYAGGVFGVRTMRVPTAP